MPRRSWSCGLQRESDLSEQPGLGTGGGEGQADAQDGFDDAGAELEKPDVPKSICRLGKRRRHGDSGKGTGAGCPARDRRQAGCWSAYSVGLIPSAASLSCKLACESACKIGSSLFGVLRSSAFELSDAPAFNVIRGASLLFGIGSSALPAWDQ